MSRANPLWGAPRIHGELAKLGIEINQAAVSKCIVRRRKPPSQSWRTFLENHAQETVSIDFFTVQTATFRVLFVLLVLSNHRRQILHFNVTATPSAAWTGQQIIEAFPWDTAPRFLLRDRDRIYGCPSREPHLDLITTFQLTAAFESRVPRHPPGPLQRLVIPVENMFSPRLKAAGLRIKRVRVRP